MSCWIAEYEHIDLVVSAMIEAGEPAAVRPTELGLYLLRENVTSFEHRYAENVTDDEKAEHVASRRAYRFTPRPNVHWPSVMLAAQSLDYQSCEHPEWQDSDGQVLLARLIAYAEKRGATTAEALEGAWSPSAANIDRMHSAEPPAPSAPTPDAFKHLWESAPW